MTISELMRAMAAAGAPLEAIAIAVEAIESRDSQIEAKRAIERDRKRKQRAAACDARPATVTRQSRDSHGNVPPMSGAVQVETSPKVSPQEIYNQPPILTPSSSLRSDGASQDLLGEIQGKAPAKPKAKTYDPDFENFWLVYPRRVGKDAAAPVFAAKVRAGATPAEIIGGAQRYAADVAALATAPEFIKHPKTWLNGGHWKDETPQQGRPPQKAASGGMAEVLRDLKLRGGEHGTGNNFTSGRTSSGPDGGKFGQDMREIPRDHEEGRDGPLLDFQRDGSGWR